LLRVVRMLPRGVLFAFCPVDHHSSSSERPAQADAGLVGQAKPAGKLSDRSVP
jgi:hypothetical protein